jgi:tetratricopeptide (TPR) repeat protein
VTRPRSILRFALLLLLPAFGMIASAQQRGCPDTDITVKVLTNTSRVIHLHAQVDLLTGSGLFMKQAFTDDNGNVQFNQVKSGRDYRLRVTDPNVEENMGEAFAIPCHDAPVVQILTIKLKQEAEGELKREESRDAMVSALELNVPGGAKKEFQKGVEAMEKKQLDRAEKYLLHAIALYPGYALAYNHLGVVYMMQSRQPQGVEAFERAVALNDHYPSALLNLAKVRIEEKKPADAEALLKKAVAADPRNAEALTILAHVELTAGEYADAAATASRVHALGDAQWSMAHWIAGRAYELDHKDAEAIGEYTIFLKESPNSALAQKARASLKALRAENYPAK